LPSEPYPPFPTKWSLFLTVNSSKHAAHQKVEVRQAKTAVSRGVESTRHDLMVRMISSSKGGHLAFFASGGVKMRAAHKMASIVCLWSLRGSPCIICQARMPAT